MQIIEKIKQDRLEARKSGDEYKQVPYFNFLLGEIEKIGKNNGNRVTTNDEAITVIKKLLNNVKISIDSNPNDIPVNLLNEKTYLENLLPSMVGEDVVKFTIKDLISKGANKGTIMKELKIKFGVTIDMKLAGNYVDEIIAQ